MRKVLRKKKRNFVHRTQQLIMITITLEVNELCIHNIGANHFASFTYLK